MTWYPTQSHYPDIKPASPCPLWIMPNISLGSSKYQFLSHWFDSTGNQIPNLPHTRPALYQFSHRTQSLLWNRKLWLWLWFRRLYLCSYLQVLLYMYMQCIKYYASITTCNGNYSLLWLWYGDILMRQHCPAGATSPTLPPPDAA